MPFDHASNDDDDKEDEDKSIYIELTVCQYCFKDFTNIILFYYEYEIQCKSNIMVFRSFCLKAPSGYKSTLSKYCKCLNDFPPFAQAILHRAKHTLKNVSQFTSLIKTASHLTRRKPQYS